MGALSPLRLAGRPAQRTTTPAAMALWRVDALLGARRQIPENGHRDGDLRSSNQKETLSGLNERLTTYLEKVRILEESNQELEEKIAGATGRRRADQDRGCDLRIIDELESQIRSRKQANAELWLGIENTKVEADGFKGKYEAELALQDAIKEDVRNLKAASSGLEMEIRCLEVEGQIFTKELEALKWDHNEERELLLEEKSKRQVNVEVDGLKPTELTDTLEKMRDQYKTLASHHQKHFESLLQQKFKETTEQNSEDMELLQSQRRHLSMLRRTVKELETELEVHRSVKSVRESALDEIGAGYTAHLENIQGTILKLEDALVKVRSEAERLTSDSRILNYLKDLLEMEIRTYGILVEDEEKRIETVMSEPSNGDPLNRQMFLFLISQSSSSLTRGLPFIDRRRHAENVGTSDFYEPILNAE